VELYLYLYLYLLPLHVSSWYVQEQLELFFSSPDEY
jgi:hypothetical protein